MYSRLPFIAFILFMGALQILFSKNKAPMYPPGALSVQATTAPKSTLANVGNISQWIVNDGFSSIAPTGNSGTLYPRGMAGIIYEDGFIWGARVDDGSGSGDIRVGGSTYRTGVQPLSGQVFRIRRDWRTLTFLDVVRETAEYFTISEDMVTEAQVRQILDQYREDWKNWPVEEGAPFVDVDNNGLYNPVYDADGLPDAKQGDYPGIKGADQVIWFKVDDQDSVQTTQLYGSQPMGVEVEMTIWSYKQPALDAGQAIFKKYKIKNISDNVFNDMYLSQWADPDIGNYTDDLVGCDSSRQMIFSYNGNVDDAEYDIFGIAPAAAGYVLLQGPVVPSTGDSAYYNGKMLADYKNLPMSSFGYFSAGNTEWTDPVLGHYDGTLQWFNLLRGYISNTNVDNPTPFTHRSTGEATKFPLDGDPVTGMGDIDGQGSNFAPSDRRMLLATGPFTLNPGEEQEMVVALMGGLGTSNISSVEVLKARAETIRSQYGRDTAYPRLAYEQSYPDNETTKLYFRADLSDFARVDSCMITLTDDSGFYPPFDLPLFDDGQHSDGEAGDGIWGNSHLFENREKPHTVNMEIMVDGESMVYPGILDGVRVRPRPLLTNLRISWEDGPQDGHLNRGENIHLRFDLENPDKWNKVNALEIKKKRSIYIGGLNSLETRSDEAWYLPLTGETDRDSLTFFYTMTFDAFRETGMERIPLSDVQTGDSYRDTLKVVSVRGTTSYILLVIADPTQMTGHTYSIAFKKDSQTGEVYWNLWDETVKELKYERGAISNDPYFPFPVVDGILFKIGNPDPGMDPEDPWGADEERWISGVNWGGSQFFGGLDLGINFLGSTITDPSFYKDIVIYWAADTINNPLTTDVATMVAASKEQFPDRWSRGQTYRRDLGYPASGTGDIPFAVYDVGQDPPQRLNVCFVEDAANGNDNLLWDMAWNNGYFASLGGREYLFFMASEYNEGVDYDDTNWGPGADVMYAIWPQARGSRTYLSDPFTMYINGADVHSDGDSLVFDSPTSLGGREVNVPQRFYLDRNYPNPFNPVTRIRFGLARNEQVRLEVFNTLGQKVRTLVNREMTAGRYTLEWDGRNDWGRPLSSGVYIYRLTAGTFSRAYKMILLK